MHQQERWFQNSYTMPEGCQSVNQLRRILGKPPSTNCWTNEGAPAYGNRKGNWLIRWTRVSIPPDAEEKPTRLPFITVPSALSPMTKRRQIIVCALLTTSRADDKVMNFIRHARKDSWSSAINWLIKIEISISSAVWWTCLSIWETSMLINNDAKPPPKSWKTDTARATRPPCNWWNLFRRLV